MRDFWERVLIFASETSKSVGDRLLQDYGNAQFEQKTDGSLVTQFDVWADETLTQAIRTEFPDHGVLSEETSHLFPNPEWCWIIDPIDGTTNFTHGIPLWAISLALLYQGTPVFGYVYLPPIQQSFHAFYGKALEMDAPDHRAFLNHRPIQSSQAMPSSSQFFSLCTRSLHIIQKNPKFPCKIRMLGVATYNLLTVAAGITLGGVEATPKIWDIAAIWAIIQAAGGVWIPLNGEQIFPLQVGENYARHCYPTLVTASEKLVPIFQPLVMK